MSLNKDKLYNNAINNSFKIKSDSIEVLKDSIKIAFSTHNNVIGFSSTSNILTLYWRDCNEIIKFKKPLNEDTCFDFVLDWLMNIDPKDRLNETIENLENGDYGFGFNIYCNENNEYELFNIACMNLYYKL